jgi:hypothetical protein
VVCKDLLPVVSGSVLAEMEHAVTQVAASKHGKKSDDTDWPRTLEQFGNALAKVFDGRIFGYFEEVRRKAFRIDRSTGIFRSARGHSPAFNDIYLFEGPENFPREFVFLFDLNTKVGLPLCPLFVRGLETGEANHAEPDFFLFDIVRADEYGFKAVQEREGVSIAKAGSFVELHGWITELMSTDPRLEPIGGFEFTPRILG